MNTILPLNRPADMLSMSASAPPPPQQDAPQGKSLREAFDSFVGQVFFGQMLKAMRQTTGKPAYFYGGQAEEIFTQQLDQILAEKLSEASASSFTGPMFELFSMQRR